jgi:5-methylcytosine-specific restriction protein A
VPSFNCRHPTCNVVLPARGWCARHEPQAKVAKAARHVRYDQTRRDREAKRFYDSAAWRRARKAKLAERPWCEVCRRAWAEAVHHDKPLAECTEEEKTAQANLVSTCAPCHSTIEARRRRQDQKAQCA